MKSRQRRDTAVMTYLEEDIAKIMDEFVTHEGSSISSYLRKLIIEDLRNRGLLTDSMLAKMLVK